MSRIATTAQKLRSELLNYISFHQEVSFDENSDIQGITGVLEDLIENPREYMKNKTYWRIEWLGIISRDTRLPESSEMISFFQVLAQNQYLEQLDLRFAFRDSTDLAAVVSALKTGRNQIKKIVLTFNLHSQYSREFHQKEFLDALDAMGNWVDLQKVIFCPPLHVNPELLKQVAPKLPTLVARDLEVAFVRQNPPTVYSENEWKLAFCCLEEGLKSNYTLQKLWFRVIDGGPVNQTLKTLGKRHFSHWFQLNKYGSRVGRKHVQFMHWFDIVALYASVDLNTLYHYLRLDPGMMFSSSSSSSTAKKTAISTTARKRPRDYDEEDAKDAEIQRLKKELKARNLEIKRLQAELSNSA